jgi:hypothetical protein
VTRLIGCAKTSSDKLDGTSSIRQHGFSHIHLDRLAMVIKMKECRLSCSYLPKISLHRDLPDALSET